MEKYEAVKIEILAFSSEDVILTSPGGSGGGSGGNQPPIILPPIPAGTEDELYGRADDRFTY